MDAVNEVTLKVGSDKSMTITVRSSGHPIDELVRLMIKALKDSQGVLE